MYTATLPGAQRGPLKDRKELWAPTKDCLSLSSLPDADAAEVATFYAGLEMSLWLPLLVHY